MVMSHVRESPLAMDSCKTVSLTMFWETQNILGGIHIVKMSNHGVLQMFCGSQNTHCQDGKLLLIN